MFPRRSKHFIKKMCQKYSDDYQGGGGDYDDDDDDDDEAPI